jgi:hypothetical protein
MPTSPAWYLVHSPKHNSPVALIADRERAGVSMVDACPVCMANMELGAVPQGTMFPLGNGWSGLLP